MKNYDIICIGAGPTGLATAIEAKRAGMQPLVIEKACLCNSLYHYPVNMVFFTTPELLEIGNLPLVSAAEKPTRVEALKYYRKAAEHYELELRLFERVIYVDGNDGNFTVVTETEEGTQERYRGKKMAVATGYYDLPNMLGVPGEDLPHVSHYYTEPHALWKQDVVVIGGKNSAAEAALRSEEHTSELQSRLHLVCRLLLEKKKKRPNLVRTDFLWSNSCQHGRYGIVHVIVTRTCS